MSRPRVQSLIKLTYWTFSVGSKKRDYRKNISPLKRILLKVKNATTKIHANQSEGQVFD